MRRLPGRAAHRAAYPLHSSFLRLLIGARLSRLLVLSATILVAACGDPPAATEDRFREGTYLLESLAGRQPPFVLNDVTGSRSTLLSDTLVLLNGSSFEIPVVFVERIGQPDTTRVGGRLSARPFRVSGDSLFFADQGAGGDTLSYRANRLTGMSRSSSKTCGGRCPIVYLRAGS